MTPTPQQQQPNPSPRTAWPEFEDAMLFNADEDQRHAHAEKMRAEAKQINANADKTSAEANKLKEGSWIGRIKIAFIYLGSALVLILIGFIAGLFTQWKLEWIP